MSLNIEEVRARIANGWAFLQGVMVYSSNLRSTKPYWASRCSELLTMVEQLECPSVSFTLSAADHHSPDLFCILSLIREPSTTCISDRERKELMLDNPQISAWFFQRRCRVFVASILKPIFGVEDYCFRFEWQHREISHLHGSLWLKDSFVPDTDK